MAPALLLTPLQVPLEPYVTNREKLLKSIRQHLAESARPLKGIVLHQGGDERTRNDTDHIEHFHTRLPHLCIEVSMTYYDEIAAVLHEQYQELEKPLLFLLLGLNTAERIVLSLKRE